MTTQEELEQEYAAFVKGLQKPGQDIKDSITPHQLEMWHMITGVCGEAGELLDAFKKHIIYGKPLDTENVLEELGDLEFYMAGVRSLVGFTREQCLEHNMTKLKKRYGDKYSNQAAIDRADKA